MSTHHVNKFAAAFLGPAPTSSSSSVSDRHQHPQEPHEQHADHHHQHHYQQQQQAAANASDPATPRSVCSTNGSCCQKPVTCQCHPSSSSTTAHHHHNAHGVILSGDQEPLFTSTIHPSEPQPAFSVFVPVFASVQDIAPHPNEVHKGQVPWRCNNCAAHAFGHRCASCGKSRDAAALRVFVGQLCREGAAEMVLSMIKHLCDPSVLSAPPLHVEPHTHADTTFGKGCCWVYVNSVEDIRYIVARLHKRTFVTVSPATGAVGFRVFHSTSASDMLSEEDIHNEFLAERATLPHKVQELLHHSCVTAEMPRSLAASLSSASAAAASHHISSAPISFKNAHRFHSAYRQPQQPSAHAGYYQDGYYYHFTNSRAHQQQQQPAQQQLHQQREPQRAFSAGMPPLPPGMVMTQSAPPPSYLGSVPPPPVVGFSWAEDEEDEEEEQQQRSEDAAADQGAVQVSPAKSSDSDLSASGSRGRRFMWNPYTGQRIWQN